MPIVIKQQDFTETADRVLVSVPLNGVKADKADIYANDLYIKINFPPFFYETDLLHAIDPEESEAVVGDGCVKFSMKKVDPKLWGSLNAVNLTPLEVRTRREDAFTRELARVAKQREAKAIKKREEHYRLIQEQITIERAEKERIDEMKAEEKRIAEEGIQQWKKQMAQQKIESSRSTVRELKPDSQADGIMAKLNSEEEVKQPAETNRTDSAIFDASDAIEPVAAPADDLSDDSEDDLDMDEIRAKVRKEMDTKWVHRINQAWEKDSKSRVDTLYDPVSADEKNPFFLKDKGNAFFKTGNLQAAINAYTAALEIEPTLIACLTNRAICHLKLSTYPSCIQDCTLALDLLTTEHDRKMDRDPMKQMPHVPAFNATRVKLLVRRAAAMVKMGEVDKAAKDYEVAVGLDPKNAEVKADWESLMQSVGGR
ncbi:Dynein assembly factor 4, axonemal [Podochytrium sp. JEL0797]|nr:Dynein assembly factor 4, axonemal [Podochytrium sp. JEL0797]